MALKVQDDASVAALQTARRTHPVRVLLDQVAQGYQPTAEDVEPIAMMAAPEDRDAVRDQIAEVAAQCRRLHAQGANGPAHRLANDTAYELARTVGPHRPPQEDLSALGPRELAQRVGRGPSALGPPPR